MVPQSVLCVDMTNYIQGLYFFLHEFTKWYTNPSLP